MMLKELWYTSRKEKIPEQRIIFQETLDQLKLEQIPDSRIKQSFENYLTDIVTKTGLRVCSAYESKAIEKFLKSAPSSLGDCILYLRAAIISPRRARVGSLFQLALEYLLRRCDLPSQRAYRIGRNDLVIPDMDTFQRRPEKAVLLQLKTTLRERWKSASLQRAIARHIVWLVTLDQNPGVESIQEMENMELPLYLPIQSYSALHGRFSKVRSLSSLPSDLEDVVR